VYAFSSVSSVTATTTYSADTSAKYSVAYSSLDGPLSNADIAISTQDDGRLTGINATSTGQGDVIVKDAISVATSVAPLLFGASAGKQHSTREDACKVITDNYTGDPKLLPSINLTYSSSIAMLTCFW
jgi:hypothetical protein